MIIKHKYNKGFLLLEMLIVIFLLSTLFTFLIIRYKNINYEHLLFFDEYLYIQSKSIASKNSNEINGIHINEKGNVNKAQTIRIENLYYVIELGGGRILVK